MGLVSYRRAAAITICIAFAVPLGCASAQERDSLSRLSVAGARFAPASSSQHAEKTISLDGSLAKYVLYAMEHHPQLTAAYETWRAETARIAVARRLPEPTISYGLFLRRVETRVGPQRHKLSFRQMMPWPSKLRTAAAAATQRARAAEARFTAVALTVRRRVALTYWRMWKIARAREIKAKQRALLSALSQAVRSRVEIGKASLADLGQIDLNVSRIDDGLRQLDEATRQARAMLIDAVGGPAELATPIAAATPSIGGPVLTKAALRDAAMAHPRISAIGYMAAAQDGLAAHARTKRSPNLIFGIDYIETGAAAMPGVTDSGKDPIIASVAVSIPLWRGAYRSDERHAHARAASLRATARGARNKANANLTHSLSSVRDATRRVATYRKTLLPQAETVYSAVVGTFQTGASSLASVIIAERTLLELRLNLVRAYADHAQAWARLEDVVGKELVVKETAR